MSELITPIRSDALNYEDIISRIKSIYSGCSTLEQNLFLKILEELSDKGYSETLETIYLVDFKEVPVDINRFLTDPEYLGESNDSGNQIYPGWWDVYNDVFDYQKDIYEVILSGATRIGKTSTAVAMMCYMTYQLMCYRNPQKYFGLKQVSRATIAFANLTKDLAEGVAFVEYNDTLKKSPWFNRHGRFTNAKHPIFIPEGDNIELVAASDSAHVLGMQLWACLVGDTKILTVDGEYTLSQLQDKEVNLYQVTDKWCVTKCTAFVKLTKYVSETIRLTFNDGSTLEGTPDHKLLLHSGAYKELQEITELDALYTVIDSNIHVCKKETIHHDNSIPVYDVINAGKYHNFIISCGVFCIVSHNCLMDEVNFARAGVKDLTISKNHMKALYNTANARITGTFKLEGRIYGKMFTCSSKNTDNDYLSDHIENQLDAGNKHLYVFDKPQWEVLPSYRFGKEKFYITVGDRFKRGFVVPDENADEAHLQEYRDQGYRVLEVPADYKPNFKADYDIALRDIAGISVAGAMGFITQELITPNVSQTRHNPFYEDYIEIDGKGNDTIERYFHLEAVPAALKGLQMYIHLDLAETSDHQGICGVVQDGTINVVDAQTEKKVMMPFLKQVFQIAIGAPRGSRMSYQKVVNFILWLKRNGFWIQCVSADRFGGSSYVLENLEQQGIETDYLSVDKTIEPYLGLRNLLYEQRLELIKHDLQEIEMINLQRNNDRIDHKPQGSSSSAVPCLANGYNSKGIGKDSSDALCGACANLIAHIDTIKPPAKSVINAISSVNIGNRGLFGTGPGVRQPLPGFGSQYRRFN